MSTWEFMAMADKDKREIFGAAPAGVRCENRRAAYAVILDPDGRVAVVRERDRWFLPGGGSLAGESAEVTVLREIQEECGRRARILGKLGEAVQYFHDSRRWYEMVAVFFQAELDRESTSSPEYELVWLGQGEEGEGFFHPCHEWALSQARKAVGHGPTTD
ncbi:unnamed protein product [marine sediment metagenome]|uniref:Nudix hydrolase domain-containing protein n=1 Tax=marine sediment metagenome TaxID=412755 RepID=X0TBH1_9ZZZZ